MGCKRGKVPGENKRVDPVCFMCCHRIASAVDLETFGVTEAVRSGSYLFMFQGTENTLYVLFDQKMLLRSWGQLASISSALVLSHRGSYLGWGPSSRMSPKAVTALGNHRGCSQCPCSTSVHLWWLLVKLEPESLF